MGAISLWENIKFEENEKDSPLNFIIEQAELVNKSISQIFGSVVTTQDSENKFTVALYLCSTKPDSFNYRLLSFEFNPSNYYPLIIYAFNPVEKYEIIENSNSFEKFKKTLSLIFNNAKTKAIINSLISVQKSSQ